MFCNFLCHFAEPLYMIYLDTYLCTKITYNNSKSKTTQFSPKHRSVTCCEMISIKGTISHPTPVCSGDSDFARYCEEWYWPCDVDTSAWFPARCATSPTSRPKSHPPLFRILRIAIVHMLNANNFQMLSSFSRWNCIIIHTTHRKKNLFHSQCRQSSSEGLAFTWPASSVECKH